MPGRHKAAAGQVTEAALSREHKRVAGKTLRRLSAVWSASMGLPSPAVKAQLIDAVNAAFVSAGLEPVYTERKVSDAASNRIYTYRVKQRKANSSLQQAGGATANLPRVRQQRTASPAAENPARAAQCQHDDIVRGSAGAGDMDCPLGAAEAAVVARPCGNEIHGCRCDEPEPATPTPSAVSLSTWTSSLPHMSSMSLTQPGGYAPVKSTAAGATASTSFPFDDEPSWLTELELDDGLTLPTPPSSPPGSPFAEMRGCWDDLPHMNLNEIGCSLFSDGSLQADSNALLEDVGASLVDRMDLCGESCFAPAA